MARQNMILAACLVALFAQAFVSASAVSPMGAPMYAPEMAPEGAPMYAPEMAPMGSPMMGPEMAPMEAPMSMPAMAPMTPPVSSPVAAPDVMAPGPAPIMSGASRNVVSSFAVMFVGFAALALY